MTARRAAIWTAKLAVSAGLMWLTLRLVGEVDLAALRLTAPLWLAVALGLLAAIVAVLALRWRMVARALGGAPEGTGIVTWAGLIWCGIAVSQVVPGGISGDAVRVWGLRARGTGIGRAVETVALDRAIGLAGLAALGGIAWAALGGGTGIAAVAGVAVTGALAALILWRWLSASGRAARLRERVAAWGGFALSGQGALAVAMAAGSHALNVAIFVAVARAFGLDLPWAASFLAVPAGLLAAVVPVSLGGWGVRELAIANGFALAGGDPSAATEASILFGLFHLGANAPALLILLVAGRGRRS